MQSQQALTVRARSNRVTINDVAQRLGLTKSTVSRALNGYPDIAARTRLAVEQAADALGYRPLRQAQAIRTGRARSLGLVLQADHHDAYRPFLTEFLIGLTETAAAEDYTVAVTTAASKADTLKVLADLSDAQRVDGFILPRTRWDDPRVAQLRALDVPFVLFGRVGNPTDCAWFDIEGEAAIAEAVHRLARLGHKRVGFIQGGEGFAYSTLRLDGYRQGVSSAGLPEDEALIGPAAIDRAQGTAATHALLGLEDPPTAIIYAVDLAAIGGYQALAQSGLTAGREVSIISYDGIPEGRFLAPPLSTFAVDSHRAGCRLADLLIQRICGVPSTDLRELARARFLEGGSHGPPMLTSSALASRVQARTPPKQ